MVGPRKAVDALLGMACFLGCLGAIYVVIMLLGALTVPVGQ
tara:strand:- start:4797 stop:4919 length:123 start_codon:yes stop_codon:yes gene_type:complete